MNAWRLLVANLLMPAASAPSALICFFVKGFSTVFLSSSDPERVDAIFSGVGDFFQTSDACTQSRRGPFASSSIDPSSPARAHQLHIPLKKSVAVVCTYKMSAPAVAKEANDKKGRVAVRTVDAIHNSIRNSVANLIRYRFDHENVAMTSSGRTRACRRTYFTLADAVIRVFENVIDKMLELTRGDGRKTLSLVCFEVAAKLLPTTTMTSDMQSKWSDAIDSVITKARNLSEQFAKARASDGAPPAEKKKKKKKKGADDEAEEEAEEDEDDDDDINLGSLNQFLQSKGFFVRATALAALTRSRLPGQWRLGGGKEMAIAFSVFCSLIAETILDKSGNHISGDSSLSSTSQPKNLAPKHIAKGIHDLGGLSHLLGDSVIIGTPLSHRPDLSACNKKRRRRSAVAASVADSSSSDGGSSSPSSDSGSDSGSSSGSSAFMVAPKRKKSRS
jgi:hypothetical protein